MECFGMEGIMIICIGREFGSGGHEIGRELAESLQVPFYDHQLVDLAIERCKPVAEELKKADEKRVNSFLYRVWYETVDKDLRGLSANDMLFKLQKETIINLSRSGQGVFVGRCADYILGQAGIPRVSLFISAPFSDRVKRKMSQLNLDAKSAVELVRKTDKQRKAYYDYYTEGGWGKPEHYDYCINSSAMSEEQTIQMIKVIVTQYIQSQADTEQHTK